MTPKEKAIELYNYYNLVETPSEMNGKGQINLVRLSYLASKKCALKAVDYILFEHYHYGSNYSDERFRYWQETKKEIEKL